MGFLARLFGREVVGSSGNLDHAVIARFEYGSTDLEALFEVERQLEAAIDEAGVGEFDGNEIAVDGSDGSLYMYGPDADKLFEVVRPVLERAECLSNVVALLRYGGCVEGVREREVRVG